MKNNSDPLVSIGVPVYNGDKYLNECLESILNQNYKNWECFIINNQSTDNTPAIARSFEKRDPRFRLITNPEHVSMVANFNNTFKPISKKAKYFKVICADDWLFPEYLTKMVNMMEKYPQAGFCSSFRMDDKTVNCYGLDYYKGPLYRGKDMLLDHLMRKYEVTGSETTVLYRIETLIKTKLYPAIYNEKCYHFDTSLAYELFNMSDLVFIFQVLSYTRRHEETYTSQISKRFRTFLNFFENELFLYKQDYPVLENEYQKIRKTYGYFLFQCHLKRFRQCLEWHHHHLAPERKFKIREMFMIVTGQILNKIKRLFIRLLNLGKVSIP
ncbi:MAG: glycosyltransferase family 2 protein [Bacteroidales bacterium]|nr:glycosyltransferase family 2 protein [Bacteroidales bacterium]